jgi:hypothetical protein
MAMMGKVDCVQKFGRKWPFGRLDCAELSIPLLESVILIYTLIIFAMLWQLVFIYLRFI